MADVAGFESNALAQPVGYVEGTSGDWGGDETAGTWQPIPGRGPVEVLALDMPSPDKVSAGIEVETSAKTLYFNLVDGSSPFAERDTLEVEGKRYNVRSVVTYDVADFDLVGYCEAVGL